MSSSLIIRRLLQVFATRFPSARLVASSLILALFVFPQASLQSFLGSTMMPQFNILRQICTGVFQFRLATLARKPFCQRDSNNSSS
ncbi:hypothetical protein C8R47DRAFT_1154942 [Mycena vitilis]|nr:hypothetical protein C8R47DRAFT_1154890 [Mycena vitilis]KAJ6465512.1 hypothetical protein C8R47DRAFT_1154916 [Mycena vitilis]KAJ6465514.1 hypothetical protein C8R47DRAFT_1154942 [Mycena vitilis]